MQIEGLPVGKSGSLEEFRADQYTVCTVQVLLPKVAFIFMELMFARHFVPCQFLDQHLVAHALGALRMLRCFT